MPQLLLVLLLALCFGLAASNLADDACDTFLTNDSGYPPPGLEICPPTLALAQNDPCFIFDPTSLTDPLTQWHPGASSCYIQSTQSPSGGIQQCCYVNGAIYLAIPGAGIGYRFNPLNPLLLPLHVIWDTTPWYNCCYLSSNISHYCPLYYSHRPANDGSGYVPPS